MSDRDLCKFLAVPGLAWATCMSGLHTPQGHVVLRQPTQPISCTSCAPCTLCTACVMYPTPCAPHPMLPIVACISVLRESRDLCFNPPRGVLHPPLPSLGGPLQHTCRQHGDRSSQFHRHALQRMCSLRWSDVFVYSPVAALPATRCLV